MSAYIVSNETITVIATAFVEYGVKFYDGEIHEAQLLYSKSGLIKGIGQSLLQTNYDSVNYRYRENTECPEFIPVEGLEINEGIVYGCIRCYNYQACELEDWEICQVKKSLDILENKLLERLIKRAGQKCEWGYDGVSLFD